MQAAGPDVVVVTSPLSDARFMVVHGSPCPYLAADKRCSIYESRPMNCRRFACFRAPGEPFMKGGPMGCLNLSLRITSSRSVRRDYAQNQRKAQRWGMKHGWTHTHDF